jgi:hypothetical protein
MLSSLAEGAEAHGGDMSAEVESMSEEFSLDDPRRRLCKSCGQSGYYHPVTESGGVNGQEWEPHEFVLRDEDMNEELEEAEQARERAFRAWADLVPAYQEAFRALEIADNRYRELRDRESDA